MSAHTQISDLTPEQRSLLTLLLRKKVAPSSAKKIVRVSRDQDLPLSVGQESRLLFELYAQRQSISIKPFRSTVGFRLTGPLNTFALESAFGEIVRRHEVFRTNFFRQGEAYVQSINPTAELMVGVADFQQLSGAAQEEAVTALAQEEVLHPFDLTRDVLLRATRVCLGPNEHAILLTTSHIIFDGWSQNLLLKELTDLYVAFANGDDVPPSEPSVQFADFAYWQRQYLQGETLEKLTSYWKQQLRGLEIVPVIELPFERQMPATPTYEAAFLSVTIPASFLNSLKDLSGRHEVTLYMLLVAALKVLLRCYTGKNDIGLITVIANRNRPEIETVIGYFANPIVLRTDLSGDPKFSEVLQSVKKVTLEAYAHQDLPFSVLLKVVNGGNPLRKPFVMLNMTPLDESAGQEIPGLGSAPLHIVEPPQPAAAGLEFHVTQGPDEMTVRMTYERERYDAATAVEILQHLLLLLENVVADPHLHLSELSCIIEESQIAA